MKANELIFMTWVIALAVGLITSVLVRTHKSEVKDDELNYIIKYNLAVKIVMYIAPLTFAVIGVFAAYLDFKQHNAQLPLSLTMATVFTILEIISVRYFHNFAVILRSDYICRKNSILKDKIIYWENVSEVKYNNTLKSVKIKDNTGKTISISTDTMIGVNALYKAIANNLNSNNPIHAEIIKKYKEYV